MTGNDQDNIELVDPFVIRVNNGKHTPAYIRLFDQEWTKQGCTIDTPEMEDPTIGKLLKYEAFLGSLNQEDRNIQMISIWCPNIPMNLDLFTLHLYDNLADDEIHFQNLRIFYPILDKYQVQSNVLEYPGNFVLTAYSRISFLMPAMSNALFYLWPEKNQ